MPQSKHRDIFETLKADILGGKCEDGRPLPSAPALMRKYGVARGTVDRAMAALESEGLIVRRKGSGTYPVKREPITFAVILPDADRPFYTRVCAGIANCANIVGGGGKYSLLWANTPLRRAADVLSFANMCVAEKVAGVFLERLKPTLDRELLTLLRAAKIPVVLLGGKPPPAGFPCDLAGINYIAHGRRTCVDLSSTAAKRDDCLIAHGELFGDVAVRLMLQRLQYGPKRPPAEVYLDLPKQKLNKKERKAKL